MTSNEFCDTLYLSSQIGERFIFLEPSSALARQNRRILYYLSKHVTK
jgi:hypothetical protein